MITLVTVGAALAAVAWFGLTSTVPEQTGGFPVVTTSPVPTYPVGNVDASEPSGMAPPGRDALAGYTRDYVTDFTGGDVPHGWNVFSGVPGGDPMGQFAASHVVISNGILSLNTWRDPRFANKWVTGGICQCEAPRTYGAYFVRSRITGGGPNEVQLLWPASNVWPPEIDFNETGDRFKSTSWTVHWGTQNHIDQRSLIIDMTAWHTWGVLWSAHAITFTADGKVWGRFTTIANIARVPMTLDFEQLAFCSAGRFCPSTPVSMKIDWVAEYSPVTSSAGSAR
ncbi:MAG TPA: glycoside hydrolase family 16 protein [Acidimicrobiales bacterium]|nr:glycoside hydrolase family 16 protein [Acidimicrobiales bacterium]